jgi:UPF0042 nucleotide-binding protein
MRFVIVTGMSGGGKRTAIKMLEDIGFYCVDNLPVPLIEKFIELVETPNAEIQKVALGLDVRTDSNFEATYKSLMQLRENGYHFEILFMDANDDTLIKRYKETRRRHPLEGDGERLEDGIRRERKILKAIKEQSDYVFDSSKLLTRELKVEMDRIFLANEEFNSLMVSVMSFGFKHGIPQDADLVFDVRFLPNPFYLDELKYLTGNDKAVQDYVMQSPDAEAFLVKLMEMLEFLLPGYVKEGKHQLVIAIGCTGGQHRSVTLANELYRRMKNKGNYGLNINHRDIR